MAQKYKISTPDFEVSTPNPEHFPIVQDEVRRFLDSQAETNKPEDVQTYPSPISGSLNQVPETPEIQKSSNEIPLNKYYPTDTPYLPAVQQSQLDPSNRRPEIDSRSSWEILKDLLSNPPLKSQYEPSKLRKFGGAVVGGLTGAAYGPQVGIQTAEAITDKPYREAYQDWATRTGALAQGTGLDINRIRAERSGLAGLGSLIRAEQTGDPKLQGDIARARDEAKSPTIKKEFEYYKSQPGNENATEDDYLAIRRNVAERISSQMITAESAQERAKKGEVFKDKSGNIINPDDLKSSEGLVLISGGNTKDQRYERVDQTLREFTAGNVRMLFPARDAMAPVAIGTARVPSTHEVQNVTSSGEQVAQQLSTTPQTSGFTVNPPNIRSQVEAGPQTPPISPVVNPPSQIQSQIQSQSQTGGTRPLGSFSEQEMRRQDRFVVPSSAAMTQIIGDPKIGLEGLDSFAHLANDTESMKRVGTAARTILNNMIDNFSSNENIGASIGGAGASFSLGGLLDYLKNISGLKKEMTEAQVRTMNDIVKSLTPEEDRFLARLIAAAGDIVGFRSVIGGGAYQWSVNRLRAELPIPGFGVKAGEGGARSYYNRLASILSSVSNGLKAAGVSDSRLPYPKQYLEEKASEFNKLGQGTKELEKKQNKYIIEKVVK